MTTQQKATVSSITSLAGVGIGATTGNVGSAVNAGEVGRVGVEDNATASINFGGNITIGKGGGLEIGVFATSGKAFDNFSLKKPKIDWREFDAGVLIATSKTVGFGAGGGVSGTYLDGGRENIDGYSKTTTVCAVVGCVGGISNDKSKPVVGAVVSYGGNSKNGVLPGGSFTQAESDTNSITIQDIFKK